MHRFIRPWAAQFRAALPIRETIKKPGRSIRYRSSRVGRRSVVCFLLTAALSSFGSYGQTGSSSSAVAQSIASKAIFAMTGGRSISDATLTGTAQWTPGASESASIVLMALGSGESRIDLALSEGTRSEIRDCSAGFAQGKWKAADSTYGMYAQHNTQTDAVWFFPVLGSLAGGSVTSYTYVGQETRNGRAVEHIRTMINPSSSTSGQGLFWTELSTMDFFIDSTSFLPISAQYNDHPDSNAYLNIAVEIDYSDYQQVSGIMVPMHIQKTMNGSPLLDIVVTNAVFNSGLNISTFSTN